MPKESTIQQINRLSEFHQAIYDQGLLRARDAQFELIDALLLSGPVRSFPELTLSPVFRCQWPSAYAAIKAGRQDRQQLEAQFVAQVLRARGGPSVRVRQHRVAASGGPQSGGSAIRPRLHAGGARRHRHWTSVLGAGLGARGPLQLGAAALGAAHSQPPDRHGGRDRASQAPVPAAQRCRPRCI
jgi:hypothetical protein